MPESTPVHDALIDSLRAEQLARWQAGDRVRIESLLAGHDPISDDTLLDLLLAEWLLLEEFGERLSLDEYVGRFPTLEVALRRQYALHEALAEESPETVALDETPSPIPPLPWRVPSAIGPYEILGELGHGGMGVVYRARQTTTNRVVALKMILAGQLGTPAAIQRFRMEAEAAATFDHPNIVPVYDVSEYEGQLYFTLKLIEGGSLAAQVSRLKSQPRESARIVASVAQAVHHAHQRGILHRDLKPANVLLDGDGTPHVTDFGLARRVEGDSGLTQTGAIVGTPSYMPPEQARGEKGLTTAADVYSLGAILYECLTGQPPFRGATPLDTVMQVISREVLPPRRLSQEVPRDLEIIALKCLEKEPSRRYASAAELAEDLERFLNDEPIHARSAGMMERAVKAARRRPAVAALIAVSVAALLALTAGGAWFTMRLNEERNEARKQERIALGERDEANKQKGIAEQQREQARLQKEAALRESAEAKKQRDRARDMVKRAAVAVDKIALAVRDSKSEERASGEPGSMLYKLALFYARMATTVTDDPDLFADDRAELADQYAASAVRLLVCAEKFGYFGPARRENRKQMQVEKDLEVVRKRGDYRELEARLK